MAASDATLADNPLLMTDGLPRFDLIEPRHVVPAVRHVLGEAQQRLEALEQNVQPTWAGVIEPLEELDRPFEFAWSPVSHLFGVMNSPELREAYEAVLDDIVSFGLRVSQSQPIYAAIKQMKEGDEWSRLDEAQRRIVDKKLLDAELSGIGLEGERRERFNQIARELSKLSTDFSNHVLDATKAWSLTITDTHDVEGLPPSLLQLAAHSYNETKSEVDPEATPETGPWRITLEQPSFGPFLQHCRRAHLREQVYRAFITRASFGELDNNEIIVRTLKLRQEKAALLGYKSFAEMSLAKKMAPSVEAVEEMFERLRSASWEPAVADMEDLIELEAEIGPEPPAEGLPHVLRDETQAEPLMHWDVAFWAERLREQRFDFTDEELRPYFSLDRVLEGLFHLAHRLFGITVVRANGEAPVWHKDVRFFKMMDERGQQIAAFYLDPYSRPQNKRPGAWMDDCLGRKWIGGAGRETGERRLQLPVAHLVCNSTPPVGDKPSLMTFREVETLFHEFGHGLQHMLTKVDYASAAGINLVEWDAVELPSQFMENWCYHKPTLVGMTAHYETGEPLPDELFEKIVAARNFRSGSMMLRQLQFGMTDMELHHRYDPEGGESVHDVQRRIAQKTSILPPLPEDRSLCAFAHIFAGGYAAGYFSYKWAEVLSADAFGAFEEAGLDNEQAVAETGRRFRDTVLSLGGSRDPMEVFRAFRGREPQPEALLRQCGLA